jgi:hypothetical protein
MFELLLVCSLAQPVGAEVLEGCHVDAVKCCDQIENVAIHFDKNQQGEPREQDEPTQQKEPDEPDDEKPPTPPHTGIHALLDGLRLDIKNLPAVPNLYIAIGGGDNVHYLSDVVFGAAVDTIAGRTVTEHGRETWTFTPAPVPGGTVLLVGRTWPQ